MSISNRFHIILITLLVPIVLLMTAIRVMVSPIYPQIEYRLPGFPDDPYGLTQADRLKWSTVAVEYLLNNANITFLSDLKFPNGTSLYNERELSHMVDVKKVIQTTFAWHIGLSALLLLLGAYAWRDKWLPVFFRGLGQGGWLTIGLIAAIFMYVAINFRDLFTYFHQIFFVGDTWLFYWTDTLIRLFPMRFWQDAFIGVGLLTVAGSCALIWVGRKWGK